jgi:hypothetical protein
VKLPEPGSRSSGMVVLRENGLVASGKTRAFLLLGDGKTAAAPSISAVADANPQLQLPPEKTAVFPLASCGCGRLMVS